MSKPNEPGELRDVDVQAISLVSRAANRQMFRLFKSADARTDETPPNGSAPAEAAEATEIAEAAVEKDEEAKGLFDVMKSYFSEKLNKSGRKISASRLGRLRDAQSIINGLIEELDSADDAETETEKGADEAMNKEEMAAMVKGAVDEAVRPFAERLEKLEKSAAEAEAKAAEAEAGEAEPKEPETPVEDIVKDAVGTALKPFLERLEKVEKARGFSNRVPEETVSKGGDDFWGDVL